MKYWGETPVQEYERHVRETWDARERKEARDRVAGQDEAPLRHPYLFDHELEKITSHEPDPTIL